MRTVKGPVDISAKDITVRMAGAEGVLLLNKEAWLVLTQGTCAKGDVLATAKVAAIQAVKSTPMMIPMCHPILVEAIEVDFQLDEARNSVRVTVTVKSTGKTGVEMEALCGTAVACLTIYDMLKYLGQEMKIAQIMLTEKTGGKSGIYKRSD